MGNPAETAAFGQRKEGVGEKFMTFKIVSISNEYATRMRSTMRDDFGRPVIEQTATGYGPCRVSLKLFVPGEDKRLLLTYTPFTADNAFNQPGPIYIHQKEVAQYSDIHRFPSEIKADKVHFPLSLIGYNKAQEMIFSKLVHDADVDELIEQIFDESPSVEFLHARNSEPCCFICTIERAEIN